MNLLEGRWFDVTSQAQHDSLRACGQLVYDSMRTSRVRKGEYTGPGRYMLLRYYQRCPRNCCDDSVNEVLSANEVANEAREQIRDLAEILKLAKGA